MAADWWRSWALASGIEAGSGMYIRNRKKNAGFFCGLLAICLPLMCPPLGAASDQLEELAKRAGIRILEKGDSTGAAEKKAVASFPMRSLAADKRGRAEAVISKCTQFRRLPKLQYVIDEPLYRYLLEHPDVAVSTWRVMGISQFQMWQTGPMEYEAAATDGSEGISDILYRDENQIIFVCEGSYRNVLLPSPLEASALIWFRTEFKPHEDGTQIVTQSTDVFVHFPSAGVAGVAKVLTPVTNGLMDRNLFEVSLYASMMSRAVRDDPEWIVSMSEDLDGVLPQRRGELAEVAKRRRESKPRQRSEKFVDRWVLESAISAEVKSDSPAAATGVEQAMPLLQPSAGGVGRISLDTGVPATKPLRSLPQRQ